MKAYLTFVALMVLGSYFVELHLIDYYKPSVELLQRTTLTTGKLYIVSYGRNGHSTSEVNGKVVECRMYFAGGAEQCRGRVPSLTAGSKLTIAFADVPAMFGTIPIAMSIAVNGASVYTATPQQVISEYMRSSRDYLPLLPGILLFLLLVLPFYFLIMFKETFRNSLLTFLRR